MIRAILAGSMLCAFTMGAIAAVGRAPARPALACSYAPTVFDHEAKRATFAGIVDVLETGGPVNTAPTLTVTATPWAIELTPTPEPVDPRATPTRRNYIDLRTPTHTPSPAPTSTALPDPHLAGRGATLAIADTVAGAHQSPFRVDWNQRAAYEDGVRAREAGFISMCPPLAPHHYEKGERYLVLVAVAFYGDTSTLYRFRIAGDDVILDDPAYPDDISRVSMDIATYRRYFDGVPAHIYEDASYGSATLAAARIPLATLVRGIDGVRRGIVPPGTGNAGLAADRGAR